MAVAIRWIQFDGEVRSTCSKETVSGSSEGRVDRGFDVQVREKFQLVAVS